MISLSIIICAVGLILLLVIFGVGIWFVMQAGQQDTVSNAREGWIHRRSDKDEQGW